MFHYFRNRGFVNGAAIVVMGAIGVWLAVILVRDVAMWADSWGWRPATGVVASTRYLSKPSLHEINYRYEVDGEWYSGEAYRQSTRNVGDPVRVLYNPDSPDESALQRSDLLGIEHFFYAGNLLVIGLILWNSLRREGKGSRLHANRATQGGGRLNE